PTSTKAFVQHWLGKTKSLPWRASTIMQISYVFRHDLSTSIWLKRLRIRSSPLLLRVVDTATVWKRFLAKVEHLYLLNTTLCEKYFFRYSLLALYSVPVL